MQIQFDSNKQYQIDAVSAVVDLFAGQRRSEAVGALEGVDAVELSIGRGFGNRVTLSGETLVENLQSIQRRQGIEPACEIGELDFSVEMETGTGKTYVYLRTIHELHRKYGFLKFLIVVPSIAIKEGVAKALRITKPHFDALYDNPLVHARTFSSQRLSDLGSFAASDSLEILLINIDAFNRATNLVRQPSRDLGGLSALDLLASCEPIVILDEPQSLEGASAKAAIEALNPLAVFRYSATHRTLSNLVFRLGPVEAYDQRLVKRVEVLSVMADRDVGSAYIRLVAISSGKRLSAKIEIDCRTAQGVRRSRKSLTTSNGDLFQASGRLHAYEGIRLVSIDAEEETIELSDGTRLAIAEVSNPEDELMKTQVHETIREHLEKELAIARYFPADNRPKVLSLFFIDRVENYVADTGKIRHWFVESFEEFRLAPRYAELNLPETFEVHRGYFSSSGGVAQDTSGKSLADQNTYHLIMKNKEQLLSTDEPVRFIFSHSALREGWDNPNVFQICTLNETRSQLKKRQELGRGLRLPLDQHGRQIHDPAVNFLTVVANESYEQFARELQREILEDTGMDFRGRLGDRRQRIAIEFRDDWKGDEEFRQFWEVVGQETRMHCSLDREKLVGRAAQALRESPLIQEPHIVARRAALEVNESGLSGRVLAERRGLRRDLGSFSIPNPLKEIQATTGLSRGLIAEILRISGRLADLLVDPDMYIKYARDAIESALRHSLVDGVTYEPTGGGWSIDSFSDDTPSAYVDRTVPVSKSPYTHVVFESATEKRFVDSLEARDDIRMFLKLPRWFWVPTPVGAYWPDWAVVKESGDGLKVYLVRETKSQWNPFLLRPLESAKISCARRHFGAIGADFDVATSADQI